jgi:hypothetical protein
VLQLHSNYVVTVFAHDAVNILHLNIAFDKLFATIRPPRLRDIETTRELLVNRLRAHTNSAGLYTASPLENRCLIKAPGRVESHVARPLRGLPRWLR